MRRYCEPVGFDGFPPVAFDFYAGLGRENSRAYWEAHASDYADAVRGPMAALTAELADEFGQAKLFRPNRDVRFSADKSPYKTHQGAYVPTAEATGWYVEVSAVGVRSGAGMYRADASRLAAMRAAIVDDRRGAELERILGTLADDGYEIDGDRLATAPRGFDRSHPRIELLRHKSLHAQRHHGRATGPDLLDAVREDWRRLRPLVDWLTATA